MGILRCHLIETISTRKTDCKDPLARCRTVCEHHPVQRHIIHLSKIGDEVEGEIVDREVALAMENSKHIVEVSRSIGHKNDTHSILHSNRDLLTVASTPSVCLARATSRVLVWEPLSWRSQRCAA